MAAGSHVRRRRGGKRLAALCAGVCLLLVGYATARLGVVPDLSWSGASGGPGPACEGPATVSVTVAPRLEAAVALALDDLTDGCRRFEVEARSERQALDSVFFGAPVPDLWIPDGDWGVSKMPVDVVSDALASTPVLLVGGAAARQVPSWGGAFARGSVVLPDPLADSAGTLALLAPRQEADAGGGDVGAARDFLVPAAQSFGELVADGDAPDTDLSSLTPTSRRMVATTEADFLEAAEGRDVLRAVVPRSGAPLMRFPLTTRADASAPVREAAQDLADWFDSERGTAALREARMRSGDGSRLAPGSGPVRGRFLPSPTARDVDDYRFTWQSMSVPSSVLAVFDVSGSMDFATPGGGTRMDVAVGAADVALDLFPGHARVGLWAFSVARGGADRDWSVLEPLRALDDVVGGTTQRERLRARTAALAATTGGGTGLYDTALAAYRVAVQRFDPAYANSVILLTDGANDDPGSLSREAVLGRLRALVDPERPVRIIAIGISQDADLASLRRIARVTGGRAHRADSAEDILRVFAQEIATR